MKYDYQALVRDIAQTRAFTRIRGVSFLGIVDHANVAQKPNRPFYSRAEHSLGVLKTGLAAIKNIEISDTDCAHLLATCLIHDMGHPPFSHSVEYAYSRSERKWNHHTVLEELLSTPSGTNKELVRVLARHSISPDRISSIVNSTDTLSFFFDCPLNIDTLDGIARSLLSLGFVVNYDQYIIASYVGKLFSGETVSGSDFLRQADAFWNSKAAFYRFLESDARIANVERNFQRSLRERVKKLRKTFFDMTDSQFAAIYPDVIRQAAAPSSQPERTSSIHQEFVIDQSIRSVDKNSLQLRYIRKKT